MQTTINGYTILVLKADKLTTNNLKNAMKRKIKRCANKTCETFDEEIEKSLKEIENLNLAFEHEIFRTRISHTIQIGDASFTYTNIFEIGLIAKGIKNII